MLPDLSLDDVAAALTAIDAHDREVWVEMAMAIKSEFGDGGFSVWDEWSASAGNYQAAAARATWRSVRAGGKVGIGSLIHRAKQGGHVFRTADLSPEEKARRREAQAQRRAELERQVEADEAARAAWHQRVAEACRQLDAEHLVDSGKSDYLQRKKVGAFGLRFVPHGVVVVTHIADERIEIISGKEAIGGFFERQKAGEIDRERISFRYLKYGTLAVPMRDAEDVLWGFQFINAQGGKQFLKFGRKQGLFHWVTSPEAADPREVFAAAEGYATAASVHMAMRWPVAVAFDAGNLQAVCTALRGQYPHARALVCGDDDHATEGNPGMLKMGYAAQAVHGVPCLPDFSVVAA